MSAHTPTAKACLCWCGEAARTLDELAQTSNLTPLDCGLEGLALMGTALSDAVVTTRNDAVFLSAAGGYGCFQTTALPYRLSSRRINIRIAPEIDTQIARGTMKENGRQMIVVANRSGRISHRIESRNPLDQLVFQSVEAGTNTHAPPKQAPPPQRVVCLSAVRNARAHWHTLDIGQHLNTIMGDGRHTRRSALPHIGHNKAFPVLLQVLVSFLSYLANAGVRYAQIVPAHGLIQSALVKHCGVQQLGKLVCVRSHRQTLVIDMDRIESAWVVRIGGASQLELYDHTGVCVALFTADPNSEVARWNELLASLPMPSPFATR